MQDVRCLLGLRNVFGIGTQAVSAMVETYGQLLSVVPLVSTFKRTLLPSTIG